MENKKKTERKRNCAKRTGVTAHRMPTKTLQGRKGRSDQPTQNPHEKDKILIGTANLAKGQKDLTKRKKVPHLKGELLSARKKKEKGKGLQRGKTQ